VGGGDCAAVKQFGLEDKMSYVYGWWCHAGNAGRAHLPGNCCYFRLIRAKTKI
jgi:hypothetical protein